MKPEFEALPLVVNSDKKQFEMVVDGVTARIEFQLWDEKMALTHTEVPRELEGRGIGSAIIEKTLVYMEANGLKLIPLCPMVIAYLEKNPEWKRILNINVKMKETSLD